MYFSFYHLRVNDGKAVDPNRQTLSQLELRAVTRPHELGIPSIRVSTSHGECVSIPCTRRPSLHGSGPCTRYVLKGTPSMRIATGKESCQVIFHLIKRFHLVPLPSDTRVLFASFPHLASDLFPAPCGKRE